MAAGFTVAEDRVSALTQFLGARLNEAGRRGDPELPIDAALTCGGATISLAEIVERLGPFGSGNAEPRFALTGVRVVKPEPVGTGHVRCFLTDSGGARLKAIAFRAADTPLGKALMSQDTPIALAGRIKLDRWNGQTRVQFQIEDAIRE